MYVGGSADPHMEEDCGASFGVQDPPGLVCDGELLESAAVFREKGVCGS